MSDDCDDDKIERELPVIPGTADTMSPSADDAILVDSPTDKYELTQRGELDVHSAITLGLASYLMQLDGAFAGTSLRFQHVSIDWADPEEGSFPLPTAAVHSEEVGAYQTDSGLAPGPPKRVKGDDGAMVATLSEIGIYRLESLTIDVVCETKTQRAGVRKMLEDALSPVEWMAGFRLVLPRYHNAIATFLVTSAQIADTPDRARSRLRPLAFRLLARCPAYRARYLPLARPLVSGSIG